MCEIKGQLMSSTILDLVINLDSKCFYLCSANHLVSPTFFSLINYIINLYN